MSSSNIEIKKAFISENKAEFIGGGMYLRDTKNVSLTDVNIENNEAKEEGGGAYLT